MTDRFYCRTLSIVLWLLGLGLWVSFFLLFRSGGPLANAPTGFRLSLLLLAIGISVAVGWASAPDNRRR